MMKNWKSVVMGQLRGCLGGLVLVAASLTVADVRADLTTTYGVNINDSGDQGFYKLFNDLFKNELQGKAYNSSNDVFNVYGVNPYTTWTTYDEAKLVEAWRGTAAFKHDLYTDGTLSFTAGKDYHSDYKGVDMQDVNLASNASISFGLEIDYTRGTGKWNEHAAWAGGGFTGVSGERIQYTLSSDPTQNSDGKIYMLALDIKDLYNAKYDTDFDQVYMFLWEDWLDGLYVSWDWAHKNAEVDWDYQDLIFIMTNLKADFPLPPSAAQAPTPEPATLAVLGLGLAGLGLTRIRLRKK